ncbi:hypothetical protein CLCR_00522 [Cladophialophora carrionii]|uniref:Uncharacterized protein n=1 Tax=Cladophialophora carrionii TaxID=86049 RepID=A0A1C1CC89_9EURO|nr:hypothetical protein CLCR_00522 [Cladophialophora carrionii]
MADTTRRPRRSFEAPTWIQHEQFVDKAPFESQIVLFKRESPTSTTTRNLLNFAQVIASIPSSPIASGTITLRRHRMDSFYCTGTVRGARTKDKDTDTTSWSTKARSTGQNEAAFLDGTSGSGA